MNSRSKFEASPSITNLQRRYHKGILYKWIWLHLSLFRRLGVQDGFPCQRICAWIVCFFSSLKRFGPCHELRLFFFGSLSRDYKLSCIKSLALSWILDFLGLSKIPDIRNGKKWPQAEINRSPGARPLQKKFLLFSFIFWSNLIPLKVCWEVLNSKSCSVMATTKY